ncbi:hypothetical protein BV210_00165 [Halorientalis sp. IM1011]|nr:hypothetical protein BV210_00165 [Halorientalis sp. IM1011]
MLIQIEGNAVLLWTTYFGAVSNLNFDVVPNIYVFWDILLTPTLNLFTRGCRHSYWKPIYFFDVLEISIE